MHEEMVGVYVSVNCLAVSVYSFRVISNWKVSETSLIPSDMVCLIGDFTQLLVLPTDVAFSPKGSSSLSISCCWRCSVEVSLSRYQNHFSGAS